MMATLCEKKNSRLTLFQQAYHWVFVFALLFCWTPFNALAYLIPFVALGWLFSVTRVRVLFERAGFWILGWFLLTAFHGILIRDYVWINSLIALITYGTFAFVYIVPTDWLAGTDLYDKMLKWVRPVMVVEAVWGIVQAYYGFTQTGSFDIANGDFVEGTIHPGLEPELAFSNVMFAANMVFLLIALLPYVLRRRYVFVFVLGSISLILASVVHVLFFFILSFFLMFLLLLPKPARKTTLVAWLMLILLPIVGYGVLTTNFETAGGFAQQIIAGDVPKSQIFLRAISEMPSQYPYMPLVGLGPGQFSSRAGLIGTGLYFGGMDNPRPLPLLSPTISEPQREYLMDLWRWHFSVSAYGSTQAPFFSWLSVFVEFGVIPVFLLFVSACRCLLILVHNARLSSDWTIAIAGGTGVLFMLLLGIQENYWEVPQAVFVGAMLLKVIYANAISTDRAQSDGNRGS